MDCDEEENNETAPVESVSANAAVNSLILDYYKKFGRKRDLEQYFSLSTAQNDLKDTSGTFWQKIKSENDSSDSGGKKSDSSQELCRISIKCSLPDPCSSQYHTKPKPTLTGGALLESLGIHVKAMEEDIKTKSESASPPIIIEEIPQSTAQNSDEESVKSYGNNSQKSFDILDTSTNKPLSPSSSITSQRKLEWDSLADVGYANESDRKTSASSLSTLERLALKQHYSNNDTKLDSVLEPPTAHSTPLDENEGKTKGKKGVGKKSTKIYKKDVEYLQVNVPHSSENNPPQTINVNLTKHISFNVEKDGKVSVENIQKDVRVSPEKVTESASPRVKLDKEMQTTLNKSKDHAPETAHKIPVLISLNTLKRQNRRKKLRMARRKLRSKKKTNKENIPVQEKSGDQVSDAESFEYMPGHMYNQNQRSVNEQSGNVAGNKSSLESSGLLTTDSSKGSKYSFSKDLEKSIDILKGALQKGNDDKNLRKQLIKQVCERLLKSKYRDDESTSDFLSGLSFSSRKLGLGHRNHTSTSTSDNSGEKLNRPKKSILRNDKFNSAALASTSQSAPNLPTATNSEKPVTSNLMKILTSNTDSDLSNKEKSSSDNVFTKTSSQELYQKYLEALKREENYKRHLKDKEMFLKQKLVCSDSALKTPARADSKVNSRLKDLIKDLTRNNYDDGSGDASKLEGGPNSSRDNDRFVPPRSQRSHSVFTLSSGNSDQNKQIMKKRFKCDLNISKPGTSKEHYCCCPLHSPKTKLHVVDSSVQVNIKSCNLCEQKIQSSKAKCSPKECTGENNGSPKSLTKMVPDDSTGDIKYVCLCNKKTIQDVPDNFMVFKCSRMAKGNEEGSSKSTNSSCRSRNISPRKNKESPSPTAVPCTGCTKTYSPRNVCEMKTTTQSSQTNFLLKMLQQRSDVSEPTSCASKKSSDKEYSGSLQAVQSKVYEATRWLQTEISINPRIPEPSLSDILIVTDCANIVSEQCRVVTKQSVCDAFSSKQTVETCNSGSSKSSGTSKGIGQFFEEDGSVRAQCSETKNTKSGSGSDCSEKYTIPLQGTNMTLMVTIGSNERKKGEDMIGQCIGTEKSKMTEQGTSLAEECSKGVQYDAGPLAIQTDHNCNIPILKKPDNPIVSTCLTTEETTFNTYPKTSPVNQRKAFRRTNTYTKTFDEYHVSSENCLTPLQKPAEPNKCNTQPICVKETQCSKPNSPRCSCQCKIKVCDSKCHKLQECETVENVKEIEVCCCGCGEDKVKCQKDCVERKTSVATQCPDSSGNKDNCNKKSDECIKSIATQCSCGCSSDKTECNRNCDERKSSISTQCSCGCCGDQDKCNKNCEEKKTNICLPKNKPEICKDHEISESRQCLCGCSGDKANCIKICEENNTKEIGTQKDPSSSCNPTPRTPESITCAPSPEGSSKTPTPRENGRKSKDCNTEGTFTDPRPKDEDCKPKTKECTKESSTNPSRPKDEVCKPKTKECTKESSTSPSRPKDEVCKPKTKECKKESSTRTPTPKDEVCKPKTKECPKESITSPSRPKDEVCKLKTKECPKQSITSTPSPKDEVCKPKTKECITPSTSKDCDEEQKPECPTSESETEKECDPILEMIKKITKKYSKTDCEKPKRKKCFKEIMTVLNYLLETDDSTNCGTTDHGITTESSNTPACQKPEKKTPKKPEKSSKKTPKPSCNTESSDCPQSTDIPATSSDSATCKVLDKIKKECERYHQKRCKGYSGKKCSVSSSTSANCEQCRRVHHCFCRNHKCKVHKKCEKQKKGVAYNLILQAAESISEETVCNNKRPLKTVVVEIPKKKDCSNVPFQEMCEKIKKKMPCSPRPPCRSQSLPNESDISSMDNFLKAQACCTVREYLERNRPDFIAKCSQRQDCLRIVSDSRNEDPCCTSPQLKMVVVHTPTCTGACNPKCQYQRGVPGTCMNTQCYDPCNEVKKVVQRDLLSVRLAQLSDVKDLDADEVRRLAAEVGQYMRQKRPAPKFLSERAMKKHSQNIYKSLPEVVQKKEEAKKESIKKTNLLMAYIFRKNLQKKALSGSVDISNYSHIIKI